MSGLIVTLQYRIRQTASATLCVYLAAVLVFAFGHRCGGGHGSLGQTIHLAGQSVSPATAPEGASHHCAACCWYSSTLGVISEPPVLLAWVESDLVQLTVRAERPVAALRLPSTVRGPPLA